MKRIIPLLLVVVCFVASGVTEAIVVENNSFELPGTDKQANWENVPGWSSDTVAGDSGVETGYSATDGDWTAFMMGSDPSVWQLIDHTIGAGEIYELTLDARVTWLGVDFQMDLYYDDGGTRVLAATQTVTLGDDMAAFSLTFNADDVGASIGNKIGIELNNVTATGGSWLGIDNVTVTVVPEPISLALLSAGVLGLFRRRKRI